MSRQEDLEREEREDKRRKHLVRALEFGMHRAIFNQGAELRGFAIKYDEVSCLMTIKADFNDVRHVAFIYSDTMMNCIISSTRAAVLRRLNWQPDKYHSNKD